MSIDLLLLIDFSQNEERTVFYQLGKYAFPLHSVKSAMRFCDSEPSFQTWTLSGISVSVENFTSSVGWKIISLPCYRAAKADVQPSWTVWCCVQQQWSAVNIHWNEEAEQPWESRGSLSLSVAHWSNSSVVPFLTMPSKSLWFVSIHFIL